MYDGETTILPAAVAAERSVDALAASSTFVASAFARSNAPAVRMSSSILCSTSRESAGLWAASASINRKINVVPVKSSIGREGSNNRSGGIGICGLSFEKGSANSIA